MRIAVVGAGAIGGYYGALLQQAGTDVVFVARGAHLAAMRDRGLRVVSAVAEPVTLRVRALEDPRQIGPVDLVLFTVKAYDSADAARLLPPLLAEDSAVLTLQNGVDSVDVLIEAVGRAHVLGGLCQIFCSLAAPGVVRQTGGLRRVVLGELDGALTPRARAAHEAFAATGVPAELSGQILVDMWEKFIFINAQGGMTALTRLPIGAIRETPETLEMYLDVADEVAAVGRAHGVPIPGGQRERVRRFALALEPGGYSSLHTDLTAGRRTELETLLGTVVRLGRTHGVPTPACRAIYAALLPHERAAQHLGPTRHED
ncbi:MAG TPA: 2-dehydropantoate 2-reductase [bacterium]|nr:2-dehydropantoate 2-reductase [bacterium]